MYAELPGFITAGRDHPAVAASTNDDRLSFERRIVDHLYGDEKRIKIKVNNMSFGCQHSAKLTKAGVRQERFIIDGNESGFNQAGV